ncbi:6453_t:CDS:2 [Entrophospora sp. SA101]|nr:6453_t:CDS:2 [Entrophospora sp. SA101]
MIEKTVTERCQKGRWSTVEDLKLTEYVNRNGPRNWKDVASYVKTRNPKQYGMGILDLVVNPFDRKEELEIIRLREEEQCRWRDIAKKIGNRRTPNSIKNIYMQKLSKSSYRPFKIQNNTRSFNKNKSTKLKISDITINKER